MKPEKKKIELVLHQNYIMNFIQQIWSVYIVVCPSVIYDKTTNLSITRSSIHITFLCHPHLHPSC